MHFIQLGDYDKYEKIVYPAGEYQVRIKGYEGQIDRTNGFLEIEARISDMAQLIELGLLISAAETCFYPITVTLPYLPFGRADRRFTPHDCDGLAFLSRYLFNCTTNLKVRSFDTHSVTADTLGFDYMPPDDYLASIKATLGDDTILLCPDLGAANRYSGIGVKFKTTYFCSKKRDPITGKLLGFDVPVEIKENGPILLFDDICDGGGTFIGITEKLREAGIKNDLHLGVSHGIFSNGLDCLFQHFKTVHTTNSRTPSLSVLISDELHLYDYRTGRPL